MIVVDNAERDDAPLVVLLHGFRSTPDDLAPFARSLGVPARFVFPEGPLDLAPLGLRGRGWWIDPDVDGGVARSQPDLVPPGIDEARVCIDALLADLRAERPNAPLIVGGFSQGAMLTLDWTLRTPQRPQALVQLSGAPICRADWAPRFSACAGQRVFFAHGRDDEELSFDAIDELQRELATHGWDVTWCPFEGRHELSVVPLRALKKFLRAQLG